jgi:hypothetical protein
MFTRAVPAVVAAALALTATACSSNAPEETPAESPAAADATHAGDHAAMKRVFFVTPKDGDTIKPDAKLEFAAEMFTIAAVPEGEVKTVRAETGHFHIAPDADCLPAGTVIPKADPWVHFGKGQNNVEITLSPGKHKLTLQAGDDQHRTMEGLCQTITVTVAE